VGCEQHVRGCPLPLRKGGQHRAGQGHAIGWDRALGICMCIPQPWMTQLTHELLTLPNSSTTTKLCAVACVKASPIWFTSI
jgi:hypothetical protein